MTTTAPAAARPDVRQGVGRAARDALLVAGRQMRVFRARPGMLVYPLVQPVVVLVLFEAVFSGLAQVSDNSYRQFLVPGVLFESIVLTAPSTGIGMVTDAASGMADRFRSLPMARSAVLAGRVLAEAVLFVPQTLLLLAVAALTGFRVRTGIVGVLGIVADTTAFGIAVAVTASWLALRLRDPETAQRALFLPMVPIAFLSSAFTPVDRLAGWLRPLARVNPVTAGVDTARALADNTPAGDAPIYLAAWVVVLIAVPGWLAVRRWTTAI